MAELLVHQGDITKLAVDAIVNAANSSLMGGGGVDGAIHAVGGSTILQACKTIVDREGQCPPGEAVVTTAGELEAAMVIHTVGPIFDDAERAAHAQTLASCYTRSLDLANQHQVKTIAFPNISTGVYRYPKLPAALVAINATVDWLESNRHSTVAQITFACFDEENAEIYRSILGA